MTEGEAPKQTNGTPVSPAMTFVRTSAFVGGLSLLLGFVAMFVFLFRVGFSAQEALFGVFRADWPMPVVLPAIGTVLAGLMIWRQMGDLPRWTREAAPALAVGYFVAVGVWLLLAQVFAVR